MSGKERILEVAEDLFAERGFTGTSMNEIAEKAGVAKSLIYHHFESKKDLWRAMVRHYHDSSDLLERFFATLSDDDPDVMVDLVTGRDGLFEFFRKNPKLVRLFSWLNVQSEFEPEYLDEELRGRIISRLRDLQRKGCIRPDINPAVIPVVVLLLTMNWFASRWLFAGWFGNTVPGEDIDDAFIGGVMDIIVRGTTCDEKA
ncbi:MAG: TetR/AcrR family transcriptional regulator [Candidatus Fermentibacter sp.]|nr:TetR/AcrR family transcriptional regulator [Candidatus Fermentibacter sp.]